jgi:mono/diheme cytochrome c family protein
MACRYAHANTPHWGNWFSLKKAVSITIVSFLLGTGCGDNKVTGNSPVSFSGDIQPLFNTYCTVCHGPEGGLDLTSYSTIMAGGLSGPAVVSGNSGASLLVQRLEGTVPPVMPPIGLPLTNEEIALIRTWIDEDALDN